MWIRTLLEESCIKNSFRIYDVRQIDCQLETYTNICGKDNNKIK